MGCRIEDLTLHWLLDDTFCHPAPFQFIILSQAHSKFYDLR